MNAATHSIAVAVARGARIHSDISIPPARAYANHCHTGLGGAGTPRTINKAPTTGDSTGT